MQAYRLHTLITRNKAVTQLPVVIEIATDHRVVSSLL